MPQSRAHASQHPRRCKETGAIITGLTPRQFAKAKPPGTLRTNSERRNQESRKYQPCGEERGHLTSPQGLPRLRAHGVQPREQRLRHLSARLRARESGGRASLEQGRKESTARGQSRPPVVPTSLLPRPARGRDHKRGFSSRRSLAVTPARCVGYPRQELPVSPTSPAPLGTRELWKGAVLHRWRRHPRQHPACTREVRFWKPVERFGHRIRVSRDTKREWSGESPGPAHCNGSHQTTWVRLSPPALVQAAPALPAVRLCRANSHGHHLTSMSSQNLCGFGGAFIQDKSIIQGELRRRPALPRHCQPPADQQLRLYQQNPGTDKVHSQLLVVTTTQGPARRLRWAPESCSRGGGKLAARAPSIRIDEEIPQTDKLSAEKSQKDRSPRARRVLQQPICIEGGLNICSVCVCPGNTWEVPLGRPMM